MVQVTHVDDDEALYRSVPPDGVEKGMIILRHDGSFSHFSGQAFSNRGRRTSVDRANLRDHQPSKTCKQPNAGVTQVFAKDVRAVGPLPVNNPKGVSTGTAHVSIEHVPIEDDPNEPDNPSHAEIFVDPDSTNRYKLLIEALAILATQQGWLVEPS